MSAVTGKNALANLIGNLSGPLIGLVMTPFYLRKIGLEGLGLVGLMTLITGVLGLFVSGATKTLQRDLSNSQAAAPEDLAGLLKGGMLFFALLALFLGGMVAIFGKSQILSMAKESRFSEQTLIFCLYVISLIMAAGVFLGAMVMALAALRDQVWVSMQTTLVSIALALLTWFSLSRSPTLEVFYICQLTGALTGLLVVFLRLCWVTRQISRNTPQRPAKRVWQGKLRENGRLAAILIAHEGMGMIISQIDRLLVTSLFPLAALGAYNLSASPSRMTGIITSPVNTAVYPELCHFAATGASREIVGEYISRIAFVLCLLFTGIMLVFISSGQQLLSLWLGESHVPAQGALCLVLLSGGHLLLAMAVPFYNLTVAYGKVGYGIPQNIIALILLPPLGYAAAKLWGLPGAASTWLVYGLYCVLGCAWMVYRRHGNISAGARWLAGCCLSLTSGAVLAAVIHSLPLTGWVKVAAASLGAIFLTLAFVMKYFGLNLRSWPHALEIKFPVHG